MTAHHFGKALALTAACLLLILSVCGASFAADVKFGKINYEAIQRNSQKIAAGIHEIQKMQQEAQTKIAALTKEATELETKVNEGKDALSAQEKAKLENELNEKRQELDTERQALRVKLAFKQKSLTNAISPLINEIIAKIAKEDSLAVVFRSDAVAYSADIVDITERVIKALDTAPPPTEPQPKP
jgi:Skp family chaperone for outer membrane proteins